MKRLFSKTAGFAGVDVVLLVIAALVAVLTYKVFFA